MKMNKKKALAIVHQLYADIVKLGTNPMMEWEAERMVTDAESKPAKFFKTEEATEGFCKILDEMKTNGKLLDL